MEEISWQDFEKVELRVPSLGIVIPIPNQGAIFVGSFSAPQRTPHSISLPEGESILFTSPPGPKGPKGEGGQRPGEGLRRFNPRRLDFILDFKLELQEVATF